MGRALSGGFCRRTHILSKYVCEGLRVCTKHQRSECGRSVSGAMRIVLSRTSSHVDTPSLGCCPPSHAHRQQCAEKPKASSVWSIFPGAPFAAGWTSAVAGSGWARRSSTACSSRARWRTCTTATCLACEFLVVVDVAGGRRGDGGDVLKAIGCGCFEW